MFHGVVIRVVVMWSVLSSFDAGRRFVDAEPTVDAVILTPPLDRRVGGQVQMRCVATNLEADHIVEWRTVEPITTLRWGNSTITGMQRYGYRTTQINEMVIQEFNITNLQSSDTDEYVCNVRDFLPTGGSYIVASDRVTLSVLDSDFRFPNDSFPMCFPNGPTTVVTGTELNLLCLSDGNTQAVMMEVSRIHPASSNLTWTPSTTISSRSLMLNLTLDETNDGVSFRCVISSVPYPEVRRSCTIGPLTTPPSTTPPLFETSPSSSAIVIGSAAGGAAAAVLVLVLILLLVCRKRGVICNSDSENSDNPVGNADSASDQHTYPTHLYSKYLDVQTPTNPVFDGDQTNDPPLPMPPPLPPKSVGVRL